MALGVGLSSWQGPRAEGGAMDRSGEGPGPTGFPRGSWPGVCADWRSGASGSESFLPPALLLSQVKGSSAACSQSPPPAALYHYLPGHALRLAPVPPHPCQPPRSEAARPLKGLCSSISGSLASWSGLPNVRSVGPCSPAHSMLPHSPRCQKLCPPTVSSSLASGFYGPPKSPKYTGD